jgi:hypothetical protein
MNVEPIDASVREAPLRRVVPLPRLRLERGPSAFEGPGARLSDLVDLVVQRIRARPLASIAVSIGVGFLVDGALSFRAGRIMLANGGRQVVRELLKQVL